MVETLRKAAARGRTRTTLIDCDVHNGLGDRKALLKYLPERWRRHHELFGGRNAPGQDYPRDSLNGWRFDAYPPGGKAPGSDLPFMREQLLDRWEIEYGILNPLGGGGGQLNVEYGAALSSAMNDWQVEAWLDPEPRLRASIVVPYEGGELAATEVRRAARDPRFVQVLVVARSAELLGRRKYWPLYEAAAEHDLPIGIHFGGAGGGVPLTGVGWPSYYIEDHVGNVQAFEAHLTSFVCEGVFERFPSLRLVLIESGFAWLPAATWRLDKSWKRLKDEVPHLRRLPSEYVRDHVWITTQPMEEPHTPEHLHRVIGRIGAEKLMFATDYPHWDFDSPDQAFPIRLPEEIERRIMRENARAFYKLA
jgi:uncharacterized protein